VVAAGETVTGAECFKTFMRGHPTGVAVVTTLDEQERPCGFTCSSLCSLSLDPPLLLVCVNNDSMTLPCMRARGVFAVNLLRDRGQRAAEVFAASGRDRFAHVRWQPTPRWSLPFLVDDAHTVGECRTVTTHPAGDHTIVVGAVCEVVRAGGDFVPLLHGLHGYRAWPR
jgi:flavin reductase (DIM6/NTAB) family NADH-FMN oxidoreductase RutF